jgi:hypothetical protein
MEKKKKIESEAMFMYLSLNNGARGDNIYAATSLEFNMIPSLSILVCSSDMTGNQASMRTSQ